MDKITCSTKHATRRRSASRSRCKAGFARAAIRRAASAFLELNDGSCLANIQIVADAKLPNYEIGGEAAVARLQRDGARRSEGLRRQGAGHGGARAPRSSCTAGPIRKQYPLQKKRHSFEKLREWAHLRPRTNTFGAVARVRNRICRSIHDFFQEEGFLYLHTPIITASDCEGAGAMFRVSTIDPAKPPRNDKGDVDYAQDFFQRPAYLTVSGQLEGEIYATALGKIYTFGPTFRAENSNTTRHLAEFWMVEPEAAFFELDDNMALAERFLKRICRDVLADCQEDMQLFAEHVDKTVHRAARRTSSSAISAGSATPKRSRF